MMSFTINYKDTDNPILSGSFSIVTHTGGAPVTPEFLIDDVDIKVISEKDITYPLLHNIKLPK